MTPDEARWLWHCINCKRLNECGAGKERLEWQDGACRNFKDIHKET